MSKTASFGWECSNIHNNGADVYIKVDTAMTLTVIDFDVACYYISSLGTTGGAEILCAAGVSRGGPPTFQSGVSAYTNSVASSDFAMGQDYSPGGAQVNFNPTFGQDTLTTVILKTYVAADGSNSYTSRHVTTTPNLALNVGDYLVFHMDHLGVQLDTEMQVVLTYQ